MRTDAMRVFALAGLLTLSSAAWADANSDWIARSTGPGVLLANGFDDKARDFTPNQWNDPVTDPRAQFFDTNVKASGNGSVRFDFVQGGEGFGGEISLTLGDD